MKTVFAMMILAILLVSFDTKRDVKDVNVLKIGSSVNHFIGERVFVRSVIASPLRYQWVMKLSNEGCGQGGTRIVLENGDVLCCYGPGFKNCYFEE